MMKKRILSFVLAALMVFSIARMDVQVYADGTEITATKAADTPYTGKEYIAPCDKTKASETSPDLPSGWEWANPDFELTTEFDETEVIQKDAAGNETNRVTVQVKKEAKADGPDAPTGLIGIAPTTKNGTDGKITGVNDTMEYSTDGGQTWTAVPEGKAEISGFKGADEVLVRVKETSTTDAGASQTVTIPAFPADTTPPTGSITITTNTWNSFLNNISFGLLFKETKTVTIASSDDVAVASVKYYASNRPLSLEEVKALDSEWVDYPAAGFTLEPTNKYVVYALITDTSDNRTYLSSNGLVFLTETVPGLYVTEVTNNSFTVMATVDASTVEGVKEVGIYYREKGATGWTKVSAESITADNYITVNGLAAGNDYEVRSYAAYIDDSRMEMLEDNAVAVRTDAEKKHLGTIFVKIANETDEVKDAVITVEHGNDIIASVKTENISNDGVPVESGCFKELEDGIYNIVIRTTDGKYVETKMIIIEDGNADDVLFTVTKGELESVVAIKGEDTPPVAVDGLKEVLEDNEAVVTAEEKEKIENGQVKVEIVFEVEQKELHEAVGGTALNRLAEQNGHTIDLFLDLSLYKVTTQLTGAQAGESTTTDVGSANESVLEIAVPYNTAKAQIKVYRCHDGVVSVLTGLSGKPNGNLTDGTYFVGDGYVHIYASGFSTYAIGSLDERADGPAAPTGLSATAPTSTGGHDGTISGVTTTMEYSTDNGVTWTPVTSTKITGLAPGKVLVRVAGTDTVKPGASAEVTVPDYSAPPSKADGPAAPTGLTAVAPTSRYGTDGKILGVNDTMEYSTDGGKTWHNVVGNKITGLRSGEVLIRIKETDDTKAGDIARITVPAYRAPGDESPKTGDNNNLSFWISMLLMGAMLVGIVALVDTIRKRKYTAGE